MKTPWRFLADLVSKKPTEDTASQTEIKAIGHQPAEDAEISVATEAQDNAAISGATAIGRDKQQRPVEDIAVVDVLQPESKVEDASTKRIDDAEEKIQSNPETDRRAVTLESPAAETPVIMGQPEPVKEVAKPIQPQNLSSPSTGKKDAPAEVVKQPRTLPSPSASDVTMNEDKSAFDEMTELDEEIRDLRRKLSQKLEDQNARLRQMLGRYNKA